jgi:uncharacterized protein
MTVLREIQLTCPVCRDAFRSQIVLSTNGRGGKRTDFHERAVGTPPLPHLVHTCPRCAYSGGESDFGADAEVTPLIEVAVWGELSPKLSRGPVAGSEKYEFAARVADWRGADTRHVADLLLRAAWCCVEEGDTEAERYFRRHAVWTYERALAAYEGVASDSRAVLTYLVGELWRRIGDLELARRWFDRVPDEITDPANQQWVVEAARQQRDEPREWFGERGEPSRRA